MKNVSHGWYPPDIGVYVWQIYTYVYIIQIKSKMISHSKNNGKINRSKHFQNSFTSAFWISKSTHLQVKKFRKTVFLTDVNYDVMTLWLSLRGEICTGTGFKGITDISCLLRHEFCHFKISTRYHYVWSGATRNYKRVACNIKTS